MGKTLLLECASGIAGDMLAAALLGLGADEQTLRHTLSTLPLNGYEIKISTVNKSGIAAVDFDVLLDDAHENHDHDMDYLYGHLHDHTHLPLDAHHHEYKHEHHHAHEHRTLDDILEILSCADLTQDAYSIARKAFEILAEAEAHAHGTTLTDVHLHEVGALDSIIDIVACAHMIDELDIDEVIIPRLIEGCGTIRCAHGIVPVPVPAVVHIAAAHNLPLTLTNTMGELITPTGAALAAALITSQDVPAHIHLLASGVGAGKRAYPGVSGVVRAMLVARDTSQTNGMSDSVCVLTTDIDDSTGEELGHVLGMLLDEGALDAHAIPTVGKKNRPSWQIEVICTSDNAHHLEHVLFAQTTTIGIRHSYMQRTILPRREAMVSTPYGSLRVKTVELPDGSTRTYPEHSEIERISTSQHIPYPEVRQCVIGCIQTSKDE